MTQSFLMAGFAFVAFFSLFYFEPLHLGPIPIAVLWKAVLMIILILSLILRRGGFRINKLTAWGILFVLAGFLNESLFIDPVETISFAVKNAYIPIIFGFWLQRVSTSTQSLDRSRDFMLLLSVFIVLSTIPFLLNFISPIASGYDLSIFDDSVNTKFGFIGLFQNAHGASITMAVASGTLLWGISSTRIRMTRLFYLALITIGLIAILLTLVRTGMAVLALMTLVLLWISRNRSHLRWATAFGLFFFLAGFYLFETSETFSMRLIGLNRYAVQDVDLLQQLGSGRTLYWNTALEWFFSSSFLDQVFGFGPTLAKDHMLEAVGRRIYAHNGFIDILQFYGYFGIFAYSMFMLQVFKILLSLNRSNSYFALVSIHLGAYLLGMFIQGERYFLADALLAVSLAGATMARKCAVSQLPNINNHDGAQNKNRRHFRLMHNT